MLAGHAGMAPYLLFGFALAGLMSIWISPAWTERHLGRPGIGPVIKATLLGVPLPLCSCSVIPVVASMPRHGASRAAATSFLLSTPQTGVDSIAVTYALLGPVFAVFRPIAAIVTGLLGGSLVLAAGNGRCGPSDVPSECTDSCCSGDRARPAWLRALHMASSPCRATWYGRSWRAWRLPARSPQRFQNISSMSISARELPRFLCSWRPAFRSIFALQRPYLSLRA